MEFRIISAPSPMRPDVTYDMEVTKVTQGPEDLVPTVWAVIRPKPSLWVALMNLDEDVTVFGIYDDDESARQACQSAVGATDVPRLEWETEREGVERAWMGQDSDYYEVHEVQA
jgi:hypothetical protein